MDNVAYLRGLLILLPYRFAHRGACTNTEQANARNDSEISTSRPADVIDGCQWYRAKTVSDPPPKATQLTITFTPKPGRLVTE